MDGIKRDGSPRVKLTTRGLPEWKVPYRYGSSGGRHASGRKKEKRKEKSRKNYDTDWLDLLGNVLAI